MIKKLLNGQSKSITAAAILISSTALISRLVGLFRERIFAHHYRASYIMDAYHAAFKLPDLIYSLLIVGAISAGFIPVFTKLLNKKDKDEAWNLANNVTNILGIAIFVMAVLGIIFMEQLIPLIAPGFDVVTMDLAVQLGRVMFISMILLSISMVMGTILQSLRSFIIFSIAPIFYNLGIIIGVVFFVPLMGIIGIAWGVVLGSAIHFAMQTYGAYQHGYRWKWVFDLKHKETLQIAKMMIPRTLGLGISQINILVVTILGSLLPIGSIAIYNYANNLQGVPTGLIGIPFAIAVFPVLSQAVVKNDEKQFIQNLSQTIRQILFLIIPLSIIFLLLRAQIVRVVLGSGAFNWEDTINTANTLAFFSLGLFAQSLIPLLGRAFYAMHNTKTPFIYALISELIAIISALILMNYLGIAGLALAFSLGAILNVLMLAIGLRRITGSFEDHLLFTTIWKITIAGLLMALTIQFLKYPLAQIFNQMYFFGILMHGLLAGLGGLVIYSGICYALRLPEFLHFWGSFKRRWLKWRGVDVKESIALKN